MSYRFALENQDYSAYAGGHFFVGAPGHPALPVRLISEIFQRALALRRGLGQDGPVSLYDPCCGSAYHLAVLAFLHWQEIAAISASDIDADALSIAARNLALLTSGGVAERNAELAELHARFGKESHRAALESGRGFARRLEQRYRLHSIPTHLFPADATDPEAIAAGLQGRPVDLLLADVPYGRQVEWQQKTAVSTDATPLLSFLNALLPVLTPVTVVAIVSDKGQKAEHPALRRVERFSVGRRQIILFRPA